MSSKVKLKIGGGREWPTNPPNINPDREMQLLQLIWFGP